MKCLGFKDEVRKKCYYVDGYENPIAIEYHKNFVLQYLAYEYMAHCWIQINANESAQLQNEGLVLKDSNYQYKTKNKEEMVEYHVDSCKEFQEKMNEETTFGGKLKCQNEQRRETIDNIWT